MTPARKNLIELVIWIAALVADGWYIYQLPSNAGMLDIALGWVAMFTATYFVRQHWNRI